MEKINNFIALEQFVYEEKRAFNDNIGPSRFVQIKKYNGDDYFYYDCLLANIVILNRYQVNKWKTHQLMIQEFPFCASSNVNNDNKPDFQKKSWYIAVENAEKICTFLKKQLIKSSLSADVIKELPAFIENIEQYFGLKKLQSSITNNVINAIEDTKISTENIEKNNFVIVDNFYKTLSSPILFQELNFKEKHTNKVYLLLEKIFYNFGILSKYKMQHVYESVQKIDQYLVNHMKNIYFSQSFPMINLEEETISILTKINTYLTQEIDIYLEQCIDNQLLLIDSIHNKFKKVHQV